MIKNFFYKLIGFFIVFYVFKKEEKKLIDEIENVSRLLDY